MDILLRLLGVGLLMTGVMSLLPPGPWWFEYARHFLVQLSACCAIGGLVFAWRRQKLWAGLLWAVAALQVFAVVDALGGPSHVAAEDDDLKLLSVNVLTSNRNPQPLLDLVAEEQPDLLILLEVNQMWLDMLRSLHADFPYRAEQARGDNFGIAVWSRIPMEAKAEWNGPVEIPSIRASFPGQDPPFTLFAIHPLPPMNRRMVQSRDRQLHAVAREILKETHPVIVAGDANTTPWSFAMREFRTEADLHPARTSLTTTWPTGFPPLGIQIDHVLGSEGIAFVSCERGPDIGSDHWPLLTRFRARRSD